jgi:hypothetical protein
MSTDYQRPEVETATTQDVRKIVIGKRERERGHNHDDGLSIRSLDEESFEKADELESQRDA